MPNAEKGLSACEVHVPGRDEPSPWCAACRMSGAAPMSDAEKGLRRGWFADIDATQGGDYQWQPCLETGQGHIPCFEVWFRTKTECEEWIAANVIGVGWFPGEPTETTPLPPGEGQPR